MTHLRRALIVFGATVAGVAWLVIVLATTGRALPHHFPRGVDACFGRVYDAAFLEAHPGQRVTELYVYRAFSPGSWNADARPRAQQVAADRASKEEMSVVVLARFRDKPGAYDRSVICESGAIEGATCYADCDGASFWLYPNGRGLVIDRSRPASYVSLTGSREVAGRGVRMSFKQDGVDFRLDPMPIDTCIAAYDHAAGAE